MDRKLERHGGRYTAWVTPDVLIVDEVGYLPRAENADNVLFGVVDQRYRLHIVLGGRSWRTKHSGATSGRSRRRAHATSIDDEHLRVR